MISYLKVEKQLNNWRNNSTILAETIAWHKLLYLFYSEMAVEIDLLMSSVIHLGAAELNLQCSRFRGKEEDAAHIISKKGVVLLAVGADLRTRRNAWIQKMIRSSEHNAQNDQITAHKRKKRILAWIHLLLGSREAVTSQVCSQPLDTRQPFDVAYDGKVPTILPNTAGGALSEILTS